MLICLCMSRKARKKMPLPLKTTKLDNSFKCQITKKLFCNVWESFHCFRWEKVWNENNGNPIVQAHPIIFFLLKEKRKIKRIFSHCKWFPYFRDNSRYCKWSVHIILLDYLLPMNLLGARLRASLSVKILLMNQFIFQ